MCGRYTLARSQQELSERFGVRQLFIDLSPRYNIAPTQKVPVVLKQDDERTIENLQWGLIPGWVKDLRATKPLINARVETLAEKNSFKNSLVKRRCIVPADGFYEWRKMGSKKQPLFIHGKENQILAFAGIWDEWKNDEGVPIRTFSIITTDANKTMASVHDRMPVILAPDAEGLWLDLERKDPAELISLLGPSPDDYIEMHEVSPKVNSVKEDSPDCIEPVSQQLRLF
ncbi:MAG: SOS response-associated peptidase [Candidatus Obscuribacterales bacterium]|nr:SOS response-associated peptidase [Candidatus Obscuribacterales bacterium]